MANYKDSISKYPELDDLYQELLDEKVISENDNCTIFIRPYTFLSISSAASFICHGHRNGWDYFKDENNKDLKEIRYIIQNNKK